MGTFIFIIFIIFLLVYIRKVPPGKTAVVKRAGIFTAYKQNESYFFNPSKDSVIFVDMKHKQFSNKIEIKTKDDLHYIVSARFYYFVSDPIKYVENSRYLKQITPEVDLTIKKYFLSLSSKELTRNSNHNNKILEKLNTTLSDFGYRANDITITFNSINGVSDNCTVTKYEKVPCIHTDEVVEKKNIPTYDLTSLMSGNAIKNYDLSTFITNPIKENGTFKNIGIDSLDTLESNVNPIHNTSLRDIQDSNIDPIENH